MIPEILSPASSESVIAAVRGGADAVYLGADQFNARSRAHNFSNDTLRQAVEFCHVRGVRVYLTMNTLVRSSEIPAALQLAAYACEIGVDALILQDLGLARLLHQAAPQMPLHASTQLSCHSPAGVKALREMGFSRVILSREMSLEEIKACIGLGCEIEVFVHGALCMSVSGQCYLSSVLGGRSGNRGACAQPCRLPFRAGEHKQPATDCYALSLRDNCLYRHIRALSEIGVSSLKIEGRMKRPEYVAAAVATYKAAVQGKSADEQLLHDLQAVFSRNGFTDGYLTAKRGAPMFGNRRREDVIAADNAVLRRLAQLYQKETPRIAVWMHLSVPLRGEVVLTVTDQDGNRVQSVAAQAPQAQKQPLSQSYAAGQLQKCGGTPFYVTHIDCSIDEGLTLSAGALNALRRDALEQLNIQRTKGYRKSFTLPQSIDTEAAIGHPSSHTPFVVRLSSAEQLEAAAKQPQAADLWVIPLTLFNKTETRLPFSFAVEITRGLFGTEETMRLQLRKARSFGAKAAVCGNIGAIGLCLEEGIPIIGGFGNNLCNAFAAQQLAQYGVRAAVWSFELPPTEQPASVGMPMGLFVYGRQPLMLMRNCPVSASKGCNGCHGISAVTDRIGTVFPIMCGGGCSELLNAHTLYMADRLSHLPSADFFYFHMTDESAELCMQTLEQYRHATGTRSGITRGVYGRSSL